MSSDERVVMAVGKTTRFLSSAVNRGTRGYPESGDPTKVPIVGLEHSANHIKLATDGIQSYPFSP